VYVALFTLARTKLPSYITPCYPALALLAGTFVDHFCRSTATARARWLLPLAFGALAVTGLGLCLSIGLGIGRFLPGESWLAILGGVPLLAGVVCLVLHFRQRPQAVAISFAIGAVAFSTLVMALGAQRVDAQQTNHLLLQAINERSKSPEVASYKRLEPSWVYYGGWPIQEIDYRSVAVPVASAKRRQSSPGGPRIHVAQASPQAQASCFLAGSEERYLITTRTALAEISGCLPPGVEILAETELFLDREEHLVLLGHAKVGTRLAEKPPASGGAKSERK
jgi:4-amino-4-deoxy-L-arabinose transferase-like glycosyltransferase